MLLAQPGILAPLPPLARHLFFQHQGLGNHHQALLALQEQVDGSKTVVGFGLSLVLAMNQQVPGLRLFPAYACAGFEVPSTPTALWCWLRGQDRGELLHQSRQLEYLLQPAFRLHQSVDTFCYQSGHDLTGYEDGTENPTAEAAVAAAVVAEQGRGYDGGSFAAVQQWVHDFNTFEAMAPDQQDQAIGRRKSDNEELAEAPPSAHVKRTAQESFNPEAFILRRSMPWAQDQQGGLLFLAFGHSFDAFEAQLRRMVGAEDGITDALFQFTHPVTGAFFWCPPMQAGKPDLTALGI